MTIVAEGKNVDNRSIL